VDSSGRAPTSAGSTNADIIVYSKSDLQHSEAALHPCDPESSEETIICASSKTGEGLAELKRAMNASLFKATEKEEDLWITSEREKACLEDAIAGIGRALDLLKTNPAVELLAFEMQLVRRALQSITVEISSEDVLQSIFAGFCIGK
jgi:tRNA modification GTPase